MAFKITPVNYFYTIVADRPGQGYTLLSTLAEIGINLLGFTAIPLGPQRTQLTLFPDNADKLIDLAVKSGMPLDGPHPAILVQGDDELGALAQIHEKLYALNINVFASSGVSDGKGNFGYFLYLRPEEFERALQALKI
jgi:hypothetical protein